MSLGANAAEACKNISSKADEIRAAGDVVDSAWGFLSPKNWKSTNDAQQKLKNILGVNISDKTIQSITSTCNNVSIGTQSNIIDTSGCPYCQEHGCQVKNVKQSNKISNTQLCAASALIDSLRENKTDLQSLAAAKAIQDAQGALSGNKVTSDQCNYTNVNMSTEAYLSALATCANSSKMDQKNYIAGCGSVLDVIQENSFDNYQKCITDATTTLKSTTDISAKTSTTGDTEQKSTGLDISAIFSTYKNMILGISGFSALSCFLCSCCILLIFLLPMMKS